MVQLQAMSEKMLYDFVTREWKWNLCVVKAYLIHDV